MSDDRTLANPDWEPESQPQRGPAIGDLLGVVLETGASDLHLLAGTRPAIRLHGGLVPLEDLPVLEPQELERMVYAILPQRQREQFEQDLELDVSYSLPGRARFRVNVYRQRDSVGAAFRLVPAAIPSLEELGLPPRVAEFAREPRGLVLVTGPTGSGKSTTLAAIIDIINRERAVHIVTVEDPIEYLHAHKTAMVSQREVGADTRSFAESLRRVLRQDPDVILIGEMRDPETIQTALTAAETGHLVFATLHTQSAPQTIDRIVDAFGAEQQAQVRAQLSTTLRGVVTQQLLPSASGDGRVVATEVMVMNAAIAHMIRESKTSQMLGAIQTGGKDGMQTMDASLASLVRSGRISRLVALERAQDPEEVKRLAG